MASCFLPKHSSAATARLAGLDRDADAVPFPSPSASESKSQSQSQPKRGQRRSSPAAAPGGVNVHNAPSAEEDAVDLNDSSSDDDSDAESSESSHSGSSNDSVASDATTASHDDYASLGGGGDGDGATTATTGEEYDDGDLRTLNRLVNKLHAAELRRERRRKHDGADVDCVDDLPSTLPPPGTPPRFSPLHTPHGLSVSSVESWRGPSLEVVPTECVDGIMPLWRSEWTRDRAEWEERRRIVDVEVLRRSRTHDGRRASSGAAVGGGAADGSGGSAAYGLGRRNNSLPANALFAAARDVRDAGVERAGSAASSAASTNRNYRYGRPPSLPRANDPNPMVRKSSKKINKKHARYALCAGMMLGIREGVGGALGVEAELGISNWEGLEHSWEEGGGEEEEEEEEEEDENDEGGVEGEEGREMVLLNGSKTDGSSSSSPSRRPRSNDPSSSSSSSCENLTAVAATLTAECERVAKYKFPPHQFYLGSNTSKPLPHKYKFKVYAPLVFARIRSLFGVEKQTFLHSICGKFNFYEFASNARSGQFFFYSHDGRYMIKTLTFAESKFLREILPFYYRHLTRYPSTFLTHFYGMYRVCMPNAGNQRLHFMIMRSVFHTKKKICRVWDLKGSKANRKSEPGDSVGKDLDILEEGRRLRFAEPGARAAFLEQLRRDATFLARMGIMDYSLLLGLHNCEEERGSGGACDDAPEGGAGPSTPPAGAGGEELPRSNTPFRRGVLQRATTAGHALGMHDGCMALELDDGGEEPSRSNTPFRRGMLQRASTAGYKRGNNGFEVLELSATASGDVADNIRTAKASSALNATPESPRPSSGAKAPNATPALSRSSSDAAARVPKSAITSRSDSGIEGYGVTIGDGTLSKTREIYFCGELTGVVLLVIGARAIVLTCRCEHSNRTHDTGVIDFLQYYNAKKMGETVIKKMSSNEDISCVDPETYGNRFVKFVSSLIEKE